MRSSSARSTKNKIGTGNKRRGKRGKSEAVAAEPLEIPPSNIRRNPRNPRIEFPQSRIELLAESIEEQGVLVPVTVYRDPDEDTEYVLLDGERRWIAAKLINAPTIPAWVIAKPSGVDNVLRMFNIHMLRDEWGEMATALALKVIMEEKGVTSDQELRRMTGLSLDRIRNMKRVLAFPQEWQDRVLRDEVPFNLLVELDKAVLSKARDTSKAKVLEEPVEALRDLFLNKYLEGVFDDVVDLRKVGTLIDTAQQEGKVGERAKKALRQLVQEPGATISNAYQVGAAASVEISNVLRDLDQLPERLVDLASSPLDDEERARLREALRTLQKALTQIIRYLS